jgi:hypothetical protein
MGTQAARAVAAAATIIKLRFIQLFFSTYNAIQKNIVSLQPIFFEKRWVFTAKYTVGDCAT